MLLRTPEPENTNWSKKLTKNTLVLCLSCSVGLGSAAAQQPKQFNIDGSQKKIINSKQPELSNKSNILDNVKAKRLMQNIDKLLLQAANERNAAKKLPSKDDYFVAVPPWTETKEDREDTIRKILDSALEIATDGEIVSKQKEIREARNNITKMKAQITSLKEKRLDAPKDSLLPSIFAETVSSIDSNISDLKTRIEENQKKIKTVKRKIYQDFHNKNIEISEEQIELLLGSVLSGDIVKLVAAFDAARVIDKRLGELMAQSKQSLPAARRYFAMHAALFAMLLHAQNEIIKKIDQVYLHKLNIILDDLRKARRKTVNLLRENNRPDQRRTLLANRKAQDFSEQVATFYKDYLKAQRRKIAQSRRRTARDLSIADNTYETVEASFQLRSLIDESQSSFQALERLEAPGFGQVFQNDELRKEFEKLTEKLQVPSS